MAGDSRAVVVPVVDNPEVGNREDGNQDSGLADVCPVVEFLEVGSPEVVCQADVFPADVCRVVVFREASFPVVACRADDSLAVAFRADDSLAVACRADGSPVAAFRVDGSPVDSRLVDDSREDACRVDGSPVDVFPVVDSPVGSHQVDGFREDVPCQVAREAARVDHPYRVGHPSRAVVRDDHRCRVCLPNRDDRRTQGTEPVGLRVGSAGSRPQLRRPVAFRDWMVDRDSKSRSADLGSGDLRLVSHPAKDASMERQVETVTLVAFLDESMEIQVALSARLVWLTEFLVVSTELPVGWMDYRGASVSLVAWTDSQCWGVMAYSVELRDDLGCLAASWGVKELSAD